MLIIPVKEGESIDRALKKYKRKVDSTRILKQLRLRKQFTKPSVEKRQAKIRAIYRQKMAQQEE
ncbi:MAG: 30S ribosomal protein S21 [Flavobacteriales bacterium]